MTDQPSLSQDFAPIPFPVRRAPLPAGRVSLVGAGPGDAGLLTLRAAERLSRADVVVYDRLIGPEILAHARAGAERIYVGKRAGCHALSQSAINDLLVARARAGLAVVRLKGGDPFVFGRGGEELAFCEAAGVAVDVVAGVTAATGCAASAGLPLTLRGVASAVTFVTGHDAGIGADPDWAALAALDHTVVIYMGASVAARIAARLIAQGRAPGTPVAVIENGTLPEQRVYSGRLDGLAALVASARLVGPALLVVGPVAALATDRPLDTPTQPVATEIAL